MNSTSCGHRSTGSLLSLTLETVALDEAGTAPSRRPMNSAAFARIRREALCRCGQLMNESTAHLDVVAAAESVEVDTVGECQDERLGNRLQEGSVVGSR